MAVKVIHDRFNADPLFRQRFEREARTAAGLTHPNIVPVHEYGFTQRGRPFLTMAFLDGGSLRERLQKRGPLNVDDALAITRQIAAALVVAHSRNIVHRDLKPNNALFQGRRIDHRGERMRDAFDCCECDHTANTRSSRSTAQHRTGSATACSSACPTGGHQTRRHATGGTDNNAQPQTHCSAGGRDALTDDARARHASATACQPQTCITGRTEHRLSSSCSAIGNTGGLRQVKRSTSCGA